MDMLTDQEFATILDDTSKRVTEDVIWRRAMGHSSASEFRVAVQSDAGYPLDIVGRFNPAAGKLSYALIHKSAGRIYALDLGSAHHNPTCERVGDIHKHRWSEAFKDKQAYVPADVTADWQQPVEVWRQFCDEAKIKHTGRMSPPPAEQLELPL